MCNYKLAGDHFACSNTIEPLATLSLKRLALGSHLCPNMKFGLELANRLLLNHIHLNEN